VFLGLIGLCLGSLALRRAGGLAARAVMLASAMLLVGGAVGLGVAVPPGGAHNLQMQGVYGRGTAVPGYDRPLPYTLVCSADPLPVCVHPAYQPLLDTSRAEVNRLVAPLLGLPDGPVRAEQRPASFPSLVGDVLVFTPTDTPGDGVYISGIARDLVQERATNANQLRSRCPGDPRPCWRAQYAIAVWLIRRADLPLDSRLFSVDADTEATAARFAALDPSAQHAWLAAHYGALRRGEIRLEDMP